VVGGGGGGGAPIDYDRRRRRQQNVGGAAAAVHSSTIYQRTERIRGSPVMRYRPTKLHLSLRRHPYVITDSASIPPINCVAAVPTVQKVIHFGA